MKVSSYSIVRLLLLRSCWMLAVYFTATSCSSTSTSTHPDKHVIDAYPSTSISREPPRGQDQSQRLAELETRLALLEAEINKIRDSIRKNGHSIYRETDRVSDLETQKNDSYDVPGESAYRIKDAKRPVLRLHEKKHRHNMQSFMDIPPIPSTLPNRLPVAPLPKDQTRPSSYSNHKKKKTVEPALTEYREALSWVRNREFDNALNALSGFLFRYPNHRYSDRAIYWRGIVYYAKGEYNQALSQFEFVTHRFPSSSKVPDALLKIGMCHQRLGNIKNARNFFRKVRREYPSSKAAQMARQKEAS